MNFKTILYLKYKINMDPVLIFESFSPDQKCVMLNLTDLSGNTHSLLVQPKLLDECQVFQAKTLLENTDSFDVFVDVEHLKQTDVKLIYGFLVMSALSILETSIISTDQLIMLSKFAIYVDHGPLRKYLANSLLWIEPQNNDHTVIDDRLALIEDLDPDCIINAMLRPDDYPKASWVLIFRAVELYTRTDAGMYKLVKLFLEKARRDARLPNIETLKVFMEPYPNNKVAKNAIDGMRRILLNMDDVTFGGSPHMFKEYSPLYHYYKQYKNDRNVSQFWPLDDSLKDEHTYDRRDDIRSERLERLKALVRSKGGK